MKHSNYFILPIVAAGAVSFTSCNKQHSKPDTEEVTETALKEVVKKAAEVVAPVAEEKSGSLEELAKQAGFAKFLPQKTDAFWTFYDGAGLAKKLRASKLGKFVETMAEEKGGSIDDILTDPRFQKVAEVTGEELFFAVGEGTAAQADNLMKLSAKSNFYQMRSIVELCGKMLGERGEDIDALDDLSLEESYLKEWAKDPKTLEVFRRSSMPPIYLGYKVSDKEKREDYLAQIQGLAGMALSAQTEGETILDATEHGDFSGFIVKGSLVAEMLEKEEKDEMTEILGTQTFSDFKKAVATKDLVMLSGIHEDYIVLFIGSSVDQLKFAATPAESVLADKGMEFAQQYAGKDLVSMLYMSEELGKTTMKYSASMKELALGTLAGLKKTDTFGDTRVLEALLTDLVQREKDYYTPFKAGRIGSVAMLDEGFKIETHYGGNSPAVDLQAKRHLSKVSEGEDVVFSANWVNNPGQTELSLEYLEAIGSTGYQVAKQMSGLRLDESEFAEFTAGFAMFEGVFKKEVLDVWGALRDDLGKGLGAESAFVIDLKGELPTMPMIPEPILKQGKVPRFSYLSTVNDRSKIGQSWDRLNTSAEKLLKQVSGMSGMELPMQRPFKSESNGLTSWTFPIPTTHQNCTPNITVSDDLFVLGSSPDQANELASVFEKEATGSPLSEAQLNFEPLRDLSLNWLTLVSEHGADLMSENEVEDLKEAKPYLEALIEAADEMEYIRVENKQQGDEILSSLHFKTKS
ncbi:MAG: hypothetical protein ABGY95_11985 [Rubritalea sp.]|uniref:hypothetical protein n=1 Tax=Rubritalea sp. TaxID=2109375 RepID=UPI003242E298